MFFRGYIFLISTKGGKFWWCLKFYANANCDDEHIILSPHRASRRALKKQSFFGLIAPNELESSNLSAQSVAFYPCRYIGHLPTHIFDNSANHQKQILQCAGFDACFAILF